MAAQARAGIMTTICAYCRRAKHGDGWAMVWTRQECLDVTDGKASHGACPSCEAEQLKIISGSRSTARPVNSIQGIAGPTGDCIISLPVDTSPGEGGSAAITVGGRG
jgi:hypothetical protein